MKMNKVDFMHFVCVHSLCSRVRQAFHNYRTSKLFPLPATRRAVIAGFGSTGLRNCLFFGIISCFAALAVHPQATERTDPQASQSRIPVAGVMQVANARGAVKPEGKPCKPEFTPNIAKSYSTTPLPT